VVLERAHAKAPHSHDIRETLGRAYYACGRYAAARDQFTAAVDHNPANDYGHFALGLTLLRIGDRARAVGHLRLAAAMRPDSETYAHALARAAKPPTLPSDR
jgi:tetratricopeptide (TPR) repeat protein